MPAAATPFAMGSPPAVCEGLPGCSAGAQVAEPTVSSVPSPVELIPLSVALPGQLVAPPGIKSQTLVPAQWGLVRSTLPPTHMCSLAKGA